MPIAGKLRANLTAGLVSLSALVNLSSGYAAEEDSKATCANDAERAQRLRDDSKLVEARALLVRCSQRSCPSAVARECSVWLDELTTRLPTVVPSARDEDGNDLTALRVLLDEKLLTSEVNGSAFPTNPGRHTLRFEPRQGPSTDVTIVVREGERGRIVTATLPTKSASVPSPDARTTPSQALAITPTKGRIPAAAYVTGGIGVVSLGVASYAGIRGLLDYQDRKDRCAPDCSAEDVDSVRTILLVATVAGLVSVASWSATLAIYLGRPKGSASVSMSPTFGDVYGFTTRFTY